jgi:hypothetical protein
MPEDSEFTAKMPFTQDPEFIKLERAIQLRQEQEQKQLLDQQTKQRIEYGRQPGVTREMLDTNYQRQLNEREALSKNHKTEHDRYIREYHDAKVSELRDDEKNPAKEHSPKHTL